MDGDVATDTLQEKVDSLVDSPLAKKFDSVLDLSIRLSLSGDDVAKCRKLAKSEKKRIFNILARSLAPSIHGHEYVKKALLCQLLGGLEKVLPNGTRVLRILDRWNSASTKEGQCYT